MGALSDPELRKASLRAGQIGLSALFYLVGLNHRDSGREREVYEDRQQGRVSVSYPHPLSMLAASSCLI